MSTPLGHPFDSLTEPYERVQDLTRAWDDAYRRHRSLAQRVRDLIPHAYMRLVRNRVASAGARALCAVGRHRWGLYSDKDGWPYDACQRRIGVTILQPIGLDGRPTGEWYSRRTRCPATRHPYNRSEAL